MSSFICLIITGIINGLSHSEGPVNGPAGSEFALPRTNWLGPGAYILESCAPIDSSFWWVES